MQSRVLIVVPIYLGEKSHVCLHVYMYLYSHIYTCVYVSVAILSLDRNMKLAMMLPSGEDNWVMGARHEGKLLFTVFSCTF